MNATLPLSLLALALLAGCAKPEAASAASGHLPAVRVRLVAVTVVDAPQLTEITGAVRPARHALLAAKLMGTVEELPVTLGQRVSRGELLLKISAAEISARVAQAGAQLNLARRDLERERDLLTRGA
ncbi:MAG: biotin/lipoyl-binding protein, partial [Caulobacterales bacterium]